MLYTNRVVQNMYETLDMHLKDWTHNLHLTQTSFTEGWEQTLGKYWV